MDKIRFEKVLLPNGEKMAYRQRGESEKYLVLIHGNQSSSVFYEKLMQKISPDINVYAIDLMGFGDSSYNKKHSIVKDWADDIKEFFDIMKIPKATVVGWSLGGGVAMEFAANYPQMVNHLVLLASVGVKGFPLYECDENLNRIISKPIYKEEDIRKEPLLMVPVMRAFDQKDGKFFKTVWKNTIFNLNEPDGETFDRYIEAILKERCFFDASVALVQFNITGEDFVVKGSGRIKHIKMPVTWIHGDKDMIVNIKTAKESIKYFEGEKNLKVIEGAGHAMFMDREEEFLKILDDILK